MKIEFESLLGCTSFTNVGEMRSVIHTLTGASDIDSVGPGELLVLLVYDMLIRVNFNHQQVMTFLTFFKKELLELGEEYEKKFSMKLPVPMETVQIADGRYACLATKRKMVDIRNAVEVERIQVPVWSFLIALPALWQHALGNLQGPSDRRSAGEAFPRAR